MAIESVTLELGTRAPEFTLVDTITNTPKSLNELKSPVATVVMFICNHCPYVIHLQEKIVAVANLYQEKGISFIAISSNDISEYPDDAPEKMQEIAKKYSYPFPYLYDETQEVAKAYQAVCTPDIYVFDVTMQLVYHGRFDDASPGNQQPITGKDLTDALDRLLNGENISQTQHPSIGCSMKWLDK